MEDEDGPPLAERIAAIEARLAIADLINTYALVVRKNTPQLAPDLFLPDGWFEIRDGHPSKSDFSVRARLEGREHIGVYLGEGKDQPHPVPLIHNLIVEVDGDTGRSTCVMEAQVYGTSHKVAGEYYDTFRRVDGKWYFASRTYTIFSGASSV